MRKLTACVLVALFSGALLVACGSSNKSTSQTTTTSGQAPGTSSTGASTSTGAAPGTSSNRAQPNTGATPSTSSNGASPNTGSAPGKSPAGRSIPTAPAPAPTPKQQLTACLQNARGLAGIPSIVRAQLEQACQKAGTAPGKSPAGRSIPTAPAPAPTPKQQLAACMQNVRSLGGIAPSVRSKLEQACQKAGTSHAGQRKVDIEVCEALAARLPSGASREEAHNLCRRAL
jgi:hypothetical protein